MSSTAYDDQFSVYPTDYPNKDVFVEDKVDWRIDHSAGRPILVYKNCSVIESEDAEYVLRLIQADRQQRAGDVYSGMDRLRIGAAMQEVKDGVGAMDALYDLAVKYGASKAAAAGFAHVANGAFATLEGQVRDEIRFRAALAATKGESNG